MSREDSRTGERWAEKTAEHSRGEREKKRPEKSGEKKEMFRVKWTSKRTVSVFCFFFVMTSLALIVCVIYNKYHLVNVHI